MGTKGLGVCRSGVVEQLQAVGFREICRGRGVILGVSAFGTKGLGFWGKGCRA